jgi:hypothetical protein
MKCIDYKQNHRLRLDLEELHAPSFQLIMVQHSMATMPFYITIRMERAVCSEALVLAKQKLTRAIWSKQVRLDLELVRWVQEKRFHLLLFPRLQIQVKKMTSAPALKHI